MSILNAYCTKQKLRWSKRALRPPVSFSISHWLMADQRSIRKEPTPSVREVQGV